MHLVLLIVLGLASCTTTQKSPTPSVGSSASTQPTTDPAEAKRVMENGAAVLDVRTAEEYREDSLPGATNIPVDELEARLPEVASLVGSDRSRPIVVYCKSGRRAAKAKQKLEAAGYSQVVNGGGLDDVR